jgi:hypothetical protein
MNERRSKLLLVLFFLTNLTFLTTFSDGNGYEGDDLNSILPMLHLNEAKQGNLLIYRYHWQPLSYEIGSTVFEFTKKPSAIFLLAPIAGATSLLLLLLIVWRDRSSSLALARSLIALLAVPELWFSGLYFNSTILGLPFALGTRILLQPNFKTVSSLFAGLFLGIAILMRLDFILAAPALALVSWQQDKSPSKVALLTLGVLAALCLAFLLNLISLARVFEIYSSSAQEITEKAQMPGWDTRVKLGVLSVMLSPVGWTILALGAPTVVFRVFRKSKVSLAAWALAFAPLCLPLPNLLSVKYAIPLLMFFPSFLVLCISSIGDHLPSRFERFPESLSLICSTAFILFSVSFFGTAPFARIGTLASRPIGTHDGQRSYGGYLWQMIALDRFSSPTNHQVVADEIRKDFFQKAGPDLLIVGNESYFSPGGAGWRDLQLELENSGIHGTVISPHQIQFERNGRRLTLMRDLPQNLNLPFNRGTGVKLYNLLDSGTDTSND